MLEYQFPCPVCCKHISIKPEEWIKGGTFTCRKCGNRVKMRPHPTITKDMKKSSK